ncbi:hypothetical protein ACFP1I_32350 [Dyadobacter subterraneus]|uniref:DUF1735 domain-containing protein n=1 Tax=Dyadobacter subterraneus TaxID=2773304 RepID=A0ABR9WE57_9BACT|nr:hypothetical protein [Dyadobacter subterraneus]MBE9463712.1 hypothetical protein [Dyadobacter subterraneus]
MSMINKYVDSFFNRILIMGLFFPMLFSSCFKSVKVEPEEMPPAEYVIQDISYFMDKNDKIDTAKVVLKDTTFYNPGSVLNVQKFTGDLNDLNKTSRFQLTNPDALPKDVKLDDLSVSVPQNWDSGSYFDLFPEKFPLNQQVNQKPYNLVSSSTENMAVNVPPRSRIVVNYSIQAFYMTCSFSAVLQNKTTGQRYPLTGSWKGLLRYDNAQTKLTEQPL